MSTYFRILKAIIRENKKQIAFCFFFFIKACHVRILKDCEPAMSILLCGRHLLRLHGNTENLPPTEPATGSFSGCMATKKHLQ